MKRLLLPRLDSVVLAGLLACLAAVLPAAAQNCRVYFGTYTDGASRGIYVSRLDLATGKLSEPQLAVETPSPCYLAVSPDGKFLYAANSIKEFKGRTAGAVSAFKIDQLSDHLTLLNQESSSGLGPCHVSVDATGKNLFVANYGSGSVKSFRLDSDGRIEQGVSFMQFSGSGVNSVRQAGPHAHFIAADLSNRFVLACDLGTDKVMIYRLDSTNGVLTSNRWPSALVPPGSGARHLAFSRDGRFAYVINEMACTISVFAWRVDQGRLDLIETLSALPPGVKARTNFTAAEILVHPSGKYVYATVRGHDSVSVFGVNLKDGRLTFLQNVPSGGKVPRGLGLDPNGRWLIVANQKTDNAVEFAIDTETGKLSATGKELNVGSPVDVKFVR